MHDQLAAGINITLERSVPPFGLGVPVRDRQRGRGGGRRLARKTVGVTHRSSGKA
jgi:hypothetical protein